MLSFSVLSTYYLHYPLQRLLALYGRGHPLTVPPDRSDCPFLGRRPCYTGGDQLRTNQAHSRWGGRGVSIMRSPDTPPSSIRKGKEERKTVFLATATDPLAYSTHRGDSLPLLEQAPWTKKTLQGTFSAAPSAQSLAATKIPWSGLDVPHGWIILKWFKNWMADKTAAGRDTPEERRRRTPPGTSLLLQRTASGLST